jgi:hypothetical protein
MQFFKALLTASFLLLFSLANTALYAADKGTVQAIIPWDANGRVFQVDTRTMMFLGAFTGVMYIVISGRDARGLRNVPDHSEG